MMPQQTVTVVTYLNRAGLVNAMEGQASVWHDVLHDLDFEDVQNVVQTMAKLRLSSERWVTPGDIRAEVIKLRNRRHQSTPALPPPDQLPPDEQARRASELRRQIEDLAAAKTIDAAGDAE